MDFYSNYSTFADFFLAEYKDGSGLGQDEKKILEWYFPDYSYDYKEFKDNYESAGICILFDTN